VAFAIASSKKSASEDSEPMEEYFVSKVITFSSEYNNIRDQNST
jgi:hypothetical protein